MGTYTHSAALVVGFDLHGVATIAFVVIVFLLLVISWRFVQAKKDWGVLPASREQGRHSPHHHPPSEIIAIRMKKGIRESIVYSDSIERQLASEVASNDEGEFETSNNREAVEEWLLFIRWYRITIDPDESDQLIVAKLRNTLLPSYSSLMFLYDRIINFETAISKQSLSDAVAAFEDDSQLSRDLQSEDVYFKAIIEALAHLSSALKPGTFDLLDDRPLALEKLLRKLAEAQDTLRQAESRAGTSVMKPQEASMLRQTVKAAYEFVNKAASVSVERPVLSVTLPRGTEPIEVSTDSITLNFAIVDEKRVKGLQKITVMPRCKSDDLFYTGGPIRDIDFSNSNAVVPLTFETYLFADNHYETQPEIALEISYVFMNKHESAEFPCPMSKLIAKRQIINPFHEGTLGTGLSGKSELFVGRRDLMADISSKLLQPRPQCFLIYGLARTGKSSVLSQLAENPLWLKGRYIPIRINGQEAPMPYEFFTGCYYRLKDQLTKALPQVRQPKDAFLGKDFFPHWRSITELLRSNEEDLLQRNMRVLFLVDEAHELAKWDKDGRRIQEVDTAHYQFPEFIKVLRDQYDRIAAAVLFGLYSLSEFDHYNYRWIQQLGGRVEDRRITDLAPLEADELVQRQFRKQGIHLSNEGEERIRSYTACHAFLQMLMGYYIFEELKKGDRLHEDLVVTATDIDNAANSIPSDKLKFMWVDPWIRDKPSVRLFLGALGQLSYQRDADYAHPGSYTVDDVMEFLNAQRAGIELTELDFKFALDLLSAQKIIQEEGGRKGRYVLRYPVFALACAREHLFPFFLDEWLGAERKGGSRRHG